MRPTPYQTYLEERLQSAKGFGWEVTVNPPLQKGGRWDLNGGDFARSGRNPPQPPFCRGGSQAVFALPNLLRWLRVIR
jgi:hypothetical protein